MEHTFIAPPGSILLHIISTFDDRSILYFTSQLFSSLIQLRHYLNIFYSFKYAQLRYTFLQKLISPYSKGSFGNLTTWQFLISTFYPLHTFISPIQSHYYQECSCIFRIFGGKKRSDRCIVVVR